MELGVAGCSGNNDVLHEGSLVGQKAKRQVWAKGVDGDGGAIFAVLGARRLVLCGALRCLRKEKA